MATTAGTGSYGGGGSGSTSTGVLVAGVLSGLPAAKAGLTAGDTITSLDGKSIASRSTLSSVILGLHPGDAATLGWTDSKCPGPHGERQARSRPARLTATLALPAALLPGIIQHR